LIRRVAPRFTLLSDYGHPEAWKHHDLVSLVQFAKQSKARATITSVLKVPISSRAQQSKNWFAGLYKDANPVGKGIGKGASWRLPEHYQSALFSSLADICAQKSVPLIHCIGDVLNRE
jgi:hypothetical protein